MSVIAEPKTLWSSREVCRLIGITYRQLDHVCTMTLVDFAPGSGNHRRFTADEIDRLTVAKALLDAIAWINPRHSPWPAIVEAVFTGPEPREGWVTLTPTGRIFYSAGPGRGLNTSWRRRWPK